MCVVVILVPVTIFDFFDSSDLELIAQYFGDVLAE